jgi:acetyl-CoA C-acetyltransferase
MDVALYGVGTSTSFAKQQDRHPNELVWQAVTEALAAAQTDPRSLDAVFLGTVFGAPGVAQRALHALGIVDVPIITLENACASGTTALHEAVTAVSMDRFDTVLALGVEKMTDQFAGAIHPESTDIEGRSGLALPSLYAMAATRYQALYGVTDIDLASVAVKNHGHAVHNPRAQYRTPHTVEEVLASRMIADPLTLMQCCPIADGAGAAVVGRRRPSRAEVVVRSTVLRSGGLWDHRSEHVWGYELIRRTAHAAYEEAGVGPEDVDVIECHDAFTIGEIVTSEALGFAAEGQGHELLRRGHTQLGGPQPINPSGGLLSRGHPLGATGLAQTAEIAWQLMGQAAGRQVEGARVGVVETMGGGVAGIDGNACVIVILEAVGA